jgi:chemotaxis protein MotC
MVAGDADAQKVRIKLLAQIAEEWAGGKAKPAIDRRNMRAAIVYILSGGRPELGDDFLKTPDINEELKPLLEGAIAYSQGDKAKAAELFAPVDLEHFPPDLGGQIALVRSSLRKAEEKDLMRADLRMARALMPGTLIEEAALRRGAALAAEMRDLDEFEKLSSRYFRRFARSLYAGQFVDAFAGFVQELGYDSKPDRLPALETLIGELPSEKAAYLLLEIARNSLLRGRNAVAKPMAEKAMGLAGSGSEELARASLYLGAVMVAGDEAGFDEGVKLLEGADRAKLIEAEIKLLTSALTLARGIRAEPRLSDAPPPAEPASREPATPDAVAQFIEKAVKAMEDADKAMKDDG